MSNLPDNEIAFAQSVMEVEQVAIRLAGERLDAAFVRALDLLDGCAGTVIATGVGKSGLAARKISATLTSVGCPSIFLHPMEALHGDLGIVRREDVVLALSNSGESEELLAILPTILLRRVPIIALTGNRASTLAQKATVTLNASIEREACPLNLAPTTSVLVAIALGDALAMTLQKRRHLLPEEYALNHPGGQLGRRLTLRVRDIMREGEEALPLLPPTADFQEVLCEVSAKHVGATCIVDDAGRLLGLIAESEVRGALQTRGAAALTLAAEFLMNRHPRVILAPDQLAFEAMQDMENRLHPISVAPVVDGEQRVVGMVHVHDLVRARL